MTEEKTDALAKPANAWMQQAQNVTTGTNLNPTDLPSIVGLAQMLQKSPLLPKALMGDLGGTVLVLTQAVQMGISWSVGLKELYVLNNKVSAQARLLRALVERDPNCLQFHLKEATNERAVTVVQRRGMKEPVEVVYTLEDAKKAGLFDRNPNYKTRPREMLIARSSSLAANTYFPSVCLGIDLEEPETVYGGTAEVLDPPVVIRKRGRPAKADPLAAFEAEEVPEREVVDAEVLDEQIEEILPDEPTPAPEPPKPRMKPGPKPKADKPVNDGQALPGAMLIDQRPPMDQSGQVDSEDAKWIVDYAVQHLGEDDARSTLRKLLADFGVSGYSKLSEGVQKLTQDGYGKLIMALRAEAKEKEPPIPQDESDRPRRGRVV